MPNSENLRYLHEYESIMKYIETASDTPKVRGAITRQSGVLLPLYIRKIHTLVRCVTDKGNPINIYPDMLATLYDDLIVGKTKKKYFVNNEKGLFVIEDGIHSQGFLPMLVHVIESSEFTFQATTSEAEFMTGPFNVISTHTPLRTFTLDKYIFFDSRLDDEISQNMGEKFGHYTGAFLLRN